MIRSCALWIALCAVGCGQAPPARESACANVDCPAGSTCQEGLCLADAPDDYRIALRFVPGHDGAAAQWTPLQRISETDAVFAFRDSVTLRGTVSDGGQSVPALIELRRDVPPPGREPVVLGRPVRADSSFDITVPSAEYALTVWSVDRAASFPPRRLQLSASELEDRLTIDLPPTVGLNGAVFGTDGTPQPNVRVLAVDPDTGEALCAPVLTANQSDDAAPGTFRLVVPETTERLVLRASESDRTSALARPTIESVPVDVQGLTFHEDDRSYDLPSTLLVFPPMNTVVLSGTVEGRPRAGGRIAVAGAILRFTSEDLGAPGLDDAIGAMDRVVHAGADGSFRAELPAGTYDVEITPPAEPAVIDLGVGVVSQFVNATPEDPFQSGIVLEAPQRLALGGTATDAHGRPLEGATVWLRGGGDLSDRALAANERGVRSATVRTTRQGAFLALVDRGHFDAVVRPPEGAGLPWAILLGVPVSEDETLADPIVVSPGRLLTGIVLDQDSERATDVTVEVWCVTGQDASVLCARTTTGADGSYEVLLPASLGAPP